MNQLKKYDDDLSPSVSHCVAVYFLEKVWMELWPKKKEVRPEHFNGPYSLISRVASKQWGLFLPPVLPLQLTSIYCYCCCCRRRKTRTPAKRLWTTSSQMIRTSKHPAVSLDSEPSGTRVILVCFNFGKQTVVKWDNSSLSSRCLMAPYSCSSTLGLLFRTWFTLAAGQVMGKGHRWRPSSSCCSRLKLCLVLPLNFVTDYCVESWCKSFGTFSHSAVGYRGLFLSR